MSILVSNTFLMKKTYFVLLAILFLFSCSRPKDLVYQKTQNFGVQTSGLKQTQVTMDVCLYNPNNYRLKLKDANLDVFINGNPVGKMSVKERISIPKLDTFSIPVTLNVNLQNAFSNALEILFNGEVNLKLTGSLKASRHGVYITIPVDYESKQDLRSGIKW